MQPVALRTERLMLDTVGDRLHTDALGAARAGLVGVWIDRPGMATPDELAKASTARVRVIRSLSALPALIGVQNS